MSFLVVHDINDQTPYAILKLPEDATTRDVIKQAVAKAGFSAGKSEHDYVLLEEVRSDSLVLCSSFFKKWAKLASICLFSSFSHDKYIINTIN